MISLICFSINRSVTPPNCSGAGVQCPLIYSSYSLAARPTVSPVCTGVIAIPTFVPFPFCRATGLVGLLAVPAFLAPCFSVPIGLRGGVFLIGVLAIASLAYIIRAGLKRFVPTIVLPDDDLTIIYTLYESSHGCHHIFLGFLWC